MTLGKTIAVAITTFMAVHSSAQNLVSTTTIYVPETLSLFVSGSIINNNLLQNNGTVSLYGDWLNTGIYQGSGILIFAGTDQIINNNDQPVAKVALQGGGAKTLQGKLPVIKEINFTNGLLNVSTTDSLITGVDAIITGGSQASYVNGPIVTTGSGYRFYPVGKNGAYHPVELTDIKGAGPRIQVEVEASLPSVTTDLRSDLQHDVYWTRKTLNGSFAGSPISLGYAITAFNRQYIVIAEAPDLTSEFTVHQNNFFPEDNVTESRQDVTGNVFAIGVFLGDLPRAFYLSTSLSPNATNIENRTARVFGGDIAADNFYFQVFNRWGLVIFETRSYETMSTQGWDGKQDGNFLPSGMYPFSLKYSTLTGKPVQQTGFITILR